MNDAHSYSEPGFSKHLPLCVSSGRNRSQQPIHGLMLPVSAIVASTCWTWKQMLRESMFLIMFAYIHDENVHSRNTLTFMMKMLILEISRSSFDTSAKQYDTQLYRYDDDICLSRQGSFDPDIMRCIQRIFYDKAAFLSNRRSSLRSTMRLRIITGRELWEKSELASSWRR